jgi:stringent starvation protein B
MNAPVSPAGNGSSTRPYLIRALHEWCTDNGYTPYLAVHVDETVQVPLEYVKNGEIVLNVSFEATSALTLGNDVVSFRARFGGVARDISVPVDRVVAIYARENGQGMAFPVPAPAAPRGSAVAPLAPPAPAPLRLAGAQVPGAGEAAGVSADDGGEAGGAPDTGPPAAAGPQPDGPAPPRRPSLTRIK